MGRMPKHSLVLPTWFGRPFVASAFFAIGILMVPQQARSQTTACNELVADLAAQQQMIGIFRRSEYEIRNHFLLVANAILSTYGGWNSKGENWSSNAAQLQGSTGDFQLTAITIRRDIDRNKALNEEELQRIHGVVDDFLDLIATGDLIAAEIDQGKVDEANQIYFETARPIYLGVHGDLYTLITTAEKRVASMAKRPCN